MEHHPTQGPEDPERRRVLGWLTGGLTAIVGLLVSVGPIGMLLHPLTGARSKRPASGWRPVAPVDRFAVGAPPVRVVITEDRVDGWLSRPGTPVGPVLVQRTGERDFRVLSGICPHLGCSVGVQAGTPPFLCPCHRSSFTVEGARIEPEDGSTNPAPRPLDGLEWRVESGQLLVQWVRYRPGSPDQVPIS